MNGKKESLSLFEIEQVELIEKYPFANMKAGDSFWKSTKRIGSKKAPHQSKTAIAMRVYAHSSGKKFTSSVEEKVICPACKKGDCDPDTHKKGIRGMRFKRVS